MRRRHDENEPEREPGDAKWVSIEVTSGADASDAEPSALPPPPHDPNDRSIVARVGGWEIRRFAESGKLFRYAAPRGMLHLQLWHPERRISVLTPSRITGGRYEIFPFSGWKKGCKEWRSVLQAVRVEHGLVVPKPSHVAALERWFVAAPERAALRAHFAASVSGRSRSSSE